MRLIECMEEKVNEQMYEYQELEDDTIKIIKYNYVIKGELDIFTGK